MTDNEYLQQKIDEVKKFIEPAIVWATRGNVEHVDYDVFTINGSLYEFLIVTFNGGAYAARNCAADSSFMIAEEALKLADAHHDSNYDTDWYVSVKDMGDRSEFKTTLNTKDMRFKL